MGLKPNTSENTNGAVKRARAGAPARGWGPPGWELGRGARGTEREPCPPGAALRAEGEHVPGAEGSAAARPSAAPAAHCRVAAGHRYLWFRISTVPYCSIHSFPMITLCTQQVGLVQV